VPTADATSRYGNEPDQLVDLFGTQSPGPWHVLIHGGFWRPQYDRSHLSHFAAALAATGRRVALIEYRRIPGQPDSTTSDVLAALASLDVAGATVIGHSAGGHLALWACSSLPDLARVVAVAPVADLPRAEALDLGAGAVRAFLGGLAATRPDLDPMKLTPLCDVVVVSGDHDDRVPIGLSREYANAKRVRLVELASVGHFEPVDPLSRVFDTMLGTLDQTWDASTASKDVRGG
jgi:acetyl esterase/lipase